MLSTKQVKLRCLWSWGGPQLPRRGRGNYQLVTGKTDYNMGSEIWE
jgi:hypothetical protein